MGTLSLCENQKHCLQILSNIPPGVKVAFEDPALNQFLPLQAAWTFLLHGYAQDSCNQADQHG